MPVFKYRSVEEMPETWQHFGDRNRAGRMRAIFRLGGIAGSLHIPRGVAKFRSFDELAADRERYEQQRIARTRDRHERLRKP